MTKPLPAHHTVGLFVNQFAENWQILNVTPSKKLVGRAFTVQFMPMRPDVESAMRNQTVSDMLGPNDVIVVDMFGKIDGGKFVGDKLAYYIWTTTDSGMVVDGGMLAAQKPRGAQQTARIDRHPVHNSPARIRLGQTSVKPKVASQWCPGTAKTIVR